MDAISTQSGAFLQRREFDDLRTQEARRIVVTPAAIEDLPALLAFTAREIPTLAATEPAVVRVQRYNPESILAFHKGATPVGVYAMLLLNRGGLERLLVGELDTADPSTRWLARPGEDVAAVYSWAVVCRGIAVEGFRSVSARLSAPHCATANLYARPTNAETVKFMCHMGYAPVRSGCVGLHRYVRLCNRVQELSLAA
jgi:hypothetical protein